MILMIVIFIQHVFSLFSFISKRTSSTHSILNESFYRQRKYEMDLSDEIESSFYQISFRQL